jgi:hypothetical protein
MADKTPTDESQAALTDAVQYRAGARVDRAQHPGLRPPVSDSEAVACSEAG